MKISVARSAQVYCAGLALYLFVIRPVLLRWGATADEGRRDYPGDRAVPDPHTVSTRAVTIRAQPDQIWPWLVQMGAASWPVIVADRNEALVVEPVPGAVSWAWMLKVVDASTTRLIIRVRLGLDHKSLFLAFASAVDPVVLMERKMLHGITHRAERLPQVPST